MGNGPRPQAPQHRHEGQKNERVTRQEIQAREGDDSQDQRERILPRWDDLEEGGGCLKQFGAQVESWGSGDEEKKCWTEAEQGEVGAGIVATNGKLGRKAGE